MANYWLNDKNTNAETLRLLEQIREEVFYTKNSESLRRIVQIADAVGFPKRERRRYDLMRRSLIGAISDIRQRLHAQKHPLKRGDQVKQFGKTEIVNSVSNRGTINLMGKAGEFSANYFTKVDPAEEFLCLFAFIGKERIKLELTDLGRKVSDEFVAIEALTHLERCIVEGRIKGGELLKIHGDTSVAVTACLVNRLQTLFKVLAVQDSQSTKWIVVHSDDPAKTVGSSLR